ncbi:unnamed protein product [Prunus armeniaca]
MWSDGVGCANLTAWCSGPKGCALTRDVLLLDAVRLCAGVPTRGSPGGTIEAEKICVVEPDRGKWIVKSAFGIVKYGGVTPINPGKSRPPL